MGRSKKFVEEKESDLNMRCLIEYIFIPESLWKSKGKEKQEIQVKTKVRCREMSWKREKLLDRSLDEDKRK